MESLIIAISLGALCVLLLSFICGLYFKKQALSEELEKLEQENQTYQMEIEKFNILEEGRIGEYEKRVASLGTVLDLQLKLKAKEEEELAAKKKDEAARLLNNWQNHERSVEEVIKEACRKYGLDAVGSAVSSSLRPDNLIQIGGDLIVFDAKAPKGEDTSNFERYLAEQSTKVSKYLEIPSVRNEFYLVVPDNTLQSLNKFYFLYPDYHVFVLPLSSMHAILKLLSFYEDLVGISTLKSTDREELVSYLARSNHLLKRQVQVDSFFADQVKSLMNDYEGLNQEIREKSVEIEKTIKLNPKIDKLGQIVAFDDAHSSLKEASNLT